MHGSETGEGGKDSGEDGERIHPAGRVAAI